MRAMVVGHTEWIHFLKVDRPPIPGSISLASSWWEEAAGGGGVAAAELARLCGSCVLLSAVGSDRVGSGIAAALAPLGVTLRAAIRDEPHRRGITLLDPSGERTIIVQGDAQSARASDDLSLGDPEVVYFCKGDAELLVSARKARVLVATARVLPVLQRASVQLDALVHSASDASERYTPGDLNPEPLLVATTEGAAGGRWRTSDGRHGRWVATQPPDPIRDTYGAGDSFAAGLAFALACGRPVEEALAFAASRGAEALGRSGAHGHQGVTST